MLEVEKTAHLLLLLPLRIFVKSDQFRDLPRREDRPVVYIETEQPVRVLYSSM